MTADHDESPRDAGSVDELERRVRDLKVLQAFAATLLDYHGGIDEVLWDVAQQAVAKLDLEDCVIYVVDEDRGDLVQRAAFGPKNPREREILNPIRIPMGQGIVGSVAATGRVEMVEDTTLDPRYIRDDQMRYSELAVPIFNDGRVIGVIDSEHTRRGFFTEWHRDLLVAIAAMAAGRIASARLETQRRRLATRDSLTGLMNRSELLNLLQQRLDHASSTVVVIFLDLDHFGVINDSLSHLAGDELLAQVGQRISAHMPAGGMAARFGGDEFVAVLDGDLVAGRREAEALLAAITRVFDSGAVAGLHVGCSAGVAVGLAGNSASDLLHQADLAMYEAKRSGRGQVKVHDSRLAAMRRREQRLVVDMLRAVERRDPAIHAHFQPIHGIPDRRMVAVEALARWRHPEFGAVGPLEFIAAAERTGNIQPLGRHVLRDTFKHMAVWARLRPDLTLNINISPLQVQQDGFALQLLELLEEVGLPASRVACEVTESALLGDDRRAAQVLGALVREGIRLVLDDFGTGFASLATLTSHPFTGVKIDRGFVRDLSSSQASRAIVRSVVVLARDLGLSCTAEGVEHPEQMRILQEMGCPMAQGRGLCDALPPADLQARLSGP